MAERTSLARGTLLGVSAQLWQMITAFVLYHYLSTKLGTHGFGNWRVTLSVLNYFEMLVWTGLVQVAAKHLAERPNDRPLIERAATLGQAVIAGTLFIALELSAGLIARLLNTPELEPLIRIAAFDLPFVAALMLMSNLRLGQHHFTRQATSMMVYSTTKFLAITALVYAGLSVQGALVGNAVSSIVGFAVMFMPWKRAAVRFEEIKTEAKGMGVKAVPFFIQNLIGGVSTDASLWFVQAFEGSSKSGLYGSASVLSEIPNFLFAGLNRVLFPSVARAGAENDERLVSRYVTQGIRLAVLVTVLGVGVVASTGRAALTFVYTPAFAAAAPVLTVLMVAGIGHNVRWTCSDVMMARGQRREAMSIVIVMTIVQVALLALVTPAIGMLGAAMVAASTAVLAAAVSVWVLRALVGWRVAWTFLRSGVASAGVAIALSLLSPHGWWLLPAYVGALALYAGLLFAMREIDEADIASLRGIVRRKKA